MLGGLAAVVAAERVDVVRRRRRRLRPRRPVRRCDGACLAGWSAGCAAPGPPSSLIPGNHDSARAARRVLRIARGRRPARRHRDASLDEPVLLSDEHGDVAAVRTALPGAGGGPRRLGPAATPAARGRAGRRDGPGPRRPVPARRAPARSCSRTRSSVGGPPSESERTLRRWGRPGARRRLRRGRLRRARPPAPAADTHAAAALQRLAAGLLLRRGRAAEAGLAGRPRRARAGRRAAGAAADPAGAQHPHRHARRTAGRPGPRRCRAALRLRPPHRRRAAGRPDAPAAEAVPVLRAPGVGGRGTGRRRPQLPGAAARAQRPRRRRRVRHPRAHGRATPAERELLGRALAAAAR